MKKLKRILSVMAALLLMGGLSVNFVSCSDSDDGDSGASSAGGN